MIERVKELLEAGRRTHSVISLMRTLNRKGGLKGRGVY